MFQDQFDGNSMSKDAGGHGSRESAGKPPQKRICTYSQYPGPPNKALKRTTQ
jgi:hypothetical protein